MVQNLIAPITDSFAPPSGYAVKEDKELQQQAQTSGDEKHVQTTGEKWFDRIAYGGFAWLATLILSIAIAYYFRDSQVKVGKWAGGDGQKTWRERYPELVGQFSGFIQRKTGASQNVANEISAASALTSVTFLGGNIPIIPIKLMENKKKEIVTAINKRFGKQGEVEQGIRNVEAEPRQSWASLIRGRIVSWLIVFTSLYTSSKVIPNTFKGLERDFEVMSEKAADKVRGWQGKTSMPEAPTQNRDDYKNLTGPRYFVNRIGNITAIDLFATTASATILYVASKFFSRKSAEKKHQLEKAVDVFQPVIKTSRSPRNNQEDTPPPPPGAGQPAGPESEKPVTEKIAARGESYTAAREQEKAAVADPAQTAVAY